MQTDSIRFVLRSDFSFSYDNYNGDYIYRIGSSLSSQVKSKDLEKIYFLLGNYNLIRSEAQDFQNTWFLHLRYNQKLSNLFRFEAFVQSQNNQLLAINSRNLLGAGLRFKLVSKELVKLYLGNAYMYEEEKSDAFNTKEHNHRNSTYLSISATIAESNVSITNTIYFQPLYKNFSDYRILEQLKIDVPLSKILSLYTLLDYYHDNITPSGGSQFSTNISVGFGIRF
ncbi:DUF481 domain-containing protein [Pontimicrobium aquaticum]|nr:DUF481 domain-containing protein [Pontimicrobium aquaticum]